jgi:anti-anti-sigma regulatory factor
VRVQGGTFAVVCPEPRLQRVFQVVDLDTVLPLHTSVEEVTAPIAPQAGSVAPRD